MARRDNERTNARVRRTQSHAGWLLNPVLRNGYIQHVSGTPVTHCALCYASLVVWKGGREEGVKGRKGGREEGMLVCAVCSCTSSVVTCDAHLF